MKRRMLTVNRLKPECVETYKAYHRDVWPELLDAYRRAGITSISCFLNGCELAVYSEYEDTVYPASRAELDENVWERRWQEKMRELTDPTVEPVHYEEVFHTG